MSHQIAQNNFNQRSSEEECPLCDGQNESVMLNRALYDRYLSNIDIYYINPIQDFVQEEITEKTCQFREQICQATQEEYMKRQYMGYQFPGKIQMLSEYYKFHRNVPRIFQKNIFKLLGKYYDRLRHYDYKKIKCVLKEEQGISLTTQKSQQSSYDSQHEVKSKYSTVLGELNDKSYSQSQVLHDLCEKIDKAYEKINFNKTFKGQYYSGEKKFEEYLLSIKKLNQKHQKQKNNQKASQQSPKIKFYNLYPKKKNQFKEVKNLELKANRQTGRKKSIKKKNTDLGMKSNALTIKESLKNFKKIKNRNKIKSIEKTTANQTISREQRSRKIQKLQKTLEYELQKNSQQVFKPFSADLLNFKSNAMLKTLDQIYKPISVAENYHSDKLRKSNYKATKNQFNKIYQSKLSCRKSQRRGKDKGSSAQNSRQGNFNKKEFMTLEQNLQSHREKRDKSNLKQRNSSATKMTRYSSKKVLSRSKSVSKVGLAKHRNTNSPSSKKALKTIHYDINANKNYHEERRSKSKNATQTKIKRSKESQTYSNSIKLQKENLNENDISKLKRQSRRPETSSTKHLKIHSQIINKKEPRERSFSQKKLHSTQKIEPTQKIEKKASIANIYSARTGNSTHKKITREEEISNENIERFLQQKLAIVEKKKRKPSKSKFTPK